MINKELTITRSNTLVKASYQLTKNERRLIEISIAKISFTKGVPDMVEITAEEFVSAFPDVGLNAYRDLEQATENLYEQSIDLISPKKNVRARFRWVGAVKYFKDEGRVELDFTKWVQPYLEKLSEEYTTYRLLDIQRLNSSHAMRLYELLMQYKDTGFRVDKLVTLKQLFGVQDNYARWIDFERRVLAPSVKNINESSNWKVSYKTKRKGRNIDLIEFKFNLKNQQLLDI